MSNNTNYEELEVTNEEMQELLSEESGESTEAATPKAKKNVFARILALLLAVAPIVCACILPFSLLINSATGYTVYTEATLLDAILALFKKGELAAFYTEAGAGIVPAGEKLFGFLPLLAENGTIGKIVSLGLYVIPVVMLVTLVLAIVALCSGKKAPALVRVISFFNFWTYAGYALAIITLALYASHKLVWDVVVLAIAGVCFIVYVVCSFVKAGKKAILSFIQFLLTIVYSGAMIYGLTKYEGTGSALLPLIALSVSMFAVVVSSIRVSTKKGLVFDLIRYIAHVALAVVFLVFSFKKDAYEGLKLFTIVAAAVALIQVVLVIIAKLVNSAKAKAAIAEETTEETTEEEPATETAEEEPVEEAPATEAAEEEPVEEDATGVYAEAVPYDGPVEAPEAESVAEAQTMPVSYNFSTPDEEEEEAASPAATGGYDFYNSRSFDPFIASLNNKEREQFTELFILKYRGETKNLPDYVVGGDNTEFFRKIFIYLGQYREFIPNSLLAKMYQFASRK